MPQTRFVLQKALEFGHKIIIAINKIDRPDARLNEIGDEVLELLLNLDATDEQLDSPIVYCSGRARGADQDLRRTPRQGEAVSGHRRRDSGAGGRGVNASYRGLQKPPIYEGRFP